MLTQAITGWLAPVVIVAATAGSAQAAPLVPTH